MTFEPFQKIARLSREVIISEKIDGTNAQVYIVSYTAETANDLDPNYTACVNDPDTGSGHVIYAGSRTRMLQPDNDNFGFAAWVCDNAEELVKLGPGRHFGEWWGKGIQRGYGLKDRCFSLFNVSRWGDSVVRPGCCQVVPVIWRGVFCTETINRTLDVLERNGSLASPGFMRPEGIIVYHIAGNLFFKKTIEKDDEPKERPHE